MDFDMIFARPLMSQQVVSATGYVFIAAMLFIQVLVQDLLKFLLWIWRWVGLIFKSVIIDRLAVN